MKQVFASKKPFIQGNWQNNIDVKNFVVFNSTPYTGNADFLSNATESTKHLWAICLEAMKKERENNGCLAVDTKNISTITSHAPGYIDQTLEKIVGLQTDALLK
ncbi:MAG: pyruvate formate lyase family protein, partial [Chitinophagaceae bacterium]